MRRTKPEKRDIGGDIRYGSSLVQGLINRLMGRGKKSVATRVVFEALDLIEEKGKGDALDVLEQAVRNASPMIEVKPRRVGGATYQVPVEVPPDRRISLAMRWLLAGARARYGKSMTEKLAAELIDAAENSGAAVRKRDETHRMAEANRAFAHYRW